MTDPLHPITAFACPPRCSADGPPEDGGHKFDEQVEFFACGNCDRAGEFTYLKDGAPPNQPPSCTCDDSDTYWTGGSAYCTECGLTVMDWTLMRDHPPCDHRLVRSPRNSRTVICEHCGEGSHYLFGPPGSPEAAKLGCECPQIDNEHGLGRRGDGMKYNWYVSERCRLHMPVDELETENVNPT